MTRQEDMLRTAREVQLGNYAPAPFVLTHGRGRRVTDAGGRDADLTDHTAVVGRDIGQYQITRGAQTRDNACLCPVAIGHRFKGGERQGCNRIMIVRVFAADHVPCPAT